MEEGFTKNERSRKTEEVETEGKDQIERDTRAVDTCGLSACQQADRMKMRGRRKKRRGGGPKKPF